MPCDGDDRLAVVALVFDALVEIDCVLVLPSFPIQADDVRRLDEGPLAGGPVPEGPAGPDGPGGIG